MEKKKRKTAIVTCDNCKISFEKAVSEIKRTETKGKKHFCSLKCVGSGNVNNLGEWKGKGDVSRLKSDNRKDSYSGLREFINRARQRKKLGNLTIEDLKEQWEKQNGVCPYTGTELILPNARGKNIKGRNCELFELASLDRIDSSKPYEKNNIVFVSTPINYMKNSMSEEETVAFCKKIAYFWNNK